MMTNHRKLRARVLLTGALLHAAAPLYANPTNPTVTSGQASFNQQGSTLTVTNSNNTVINWQSFSIGQGETTIFNQSSSSSQVLNRVTGVDPSSILGTLQSNGRVFLINPNGIAFGAGAQVNVAGLVASTLNLSDADFAAGKLNFTATAGAGNLNNQGMLHSVGNIYLVAPNIQNSGIIQSDSGQVLLAAGQTVNIIDSNNPAISFEVTAPASQAVNLGQVIAHQIGIYGANVSNNGTLNANTAVAGASGQIILKASNTAVLGAGSVTTATNSAGIGGNITVQGNQVAVLGNIDASGASGGGTVLVGGDAHGANANVQNAQLTYVDANASIRADATQNGNGGKVVVWSDKTTQFNGTISATGGAQGGNGGWVEVSGKQTLGFNGVVDTTAAHGSMGSLLLDPTDITISTAANTASMTWTAGTLSYTDTVATPSNLNVTTLQNQLALTNVTVDTTSALAGVGNITVQSSIAWASANSLTLKATGAGAITVNALDLAGAALTINNTGTGGLNMQTAGGGINLSGSTTLAGGTFNANAGAGTIVISGTAGSTVVNTGAGAINLTGGWIREVGGVLSTTGTLTANSTTTSGTSLNGGTNLVGTLNATSAGMVYLINGAALNITGISASDVLINNTAATTVSGAITATNSVSLSAVGLTNNSTIKGGGSIGSAVSLNAGTGMLSNASATSVISNGGGTNVGAITLTGDKMNLAGGTITAGAGAVNLGNSTLTDAINLGSMVDTTAATLELSNAELATISTTGPLNIGSVSNSGMLTVSAPLTLNQNTTLANSSTGGMSINGAINASGRNLTLNAGGSVTQTAAITAAGLELLGVGFYTLTNTANSIGVVAGNTGSVTLTDSKPLSVGTVNATTGLTTSGSITLTSAGTISQTAAITATLGILTTSSVGGTTLNAANNVNTLAATNSGSGNISFTNNAALIVSNANNTAPGGSILLTDTAPNTLLGLAIQLASITTSNGAITLTADKIDIAPGPVSAGTGTVTLRNLTNTNAINLGSTVDTTANTLEISQTELTNIVAGQVVIGNSLNSGQIIVSAPVTYTAGSLMLLNGAGGMAINGAITAGNLSLGSSGMVTEAAGISGTNLNLVSSGGNYQLTSANVLTSVNVTSGTSATLALAGSVGTLANSGNLYISGSATVTNVQNGGTLYVQGGDVAALSATGGLTNTGLIYLGDTLSFRGTSSLSVGGAWINTGSVLSVGTVGSRVINAPLMTSSGAIIMGIDTLVNGFLYPAGTILPLGNQQALNGTAATANAITATANALANIAETPLLAILGLDTTDYGAYDPFEQKPKVCR